MKDILRRRRRRRNSSDKSKLNSRYYILRLYCPAISIASVPLGEKKAETRTMSLQVDIGTISWPLQGHRIEK